MKFAQDALNARGELMERRWQEAGRTLAVVNGNSETLWRFLAEGMVIMDELALGVHHGRAVSRGWETMSRDWLRQADAIGSDAVEAVAAAYRRAEGPLTFEEIADKLANAEYGHDDLFAFTVEVRLYPLPGEATDAIVEEMRRAIVTRKAAPAG